MQVFTQPMAYYIFSSELLFYVSCTPTSKSENRIQKPFLATVDWYLIIRPDETHETKILKTRALTFVIPCRRATKINANKIQSTANPHKQKSECSESPARPTKEHLHKIHS